MAKKRTETSKQTTTIPIEWRVPDNLITRFVSNMVIQTIENEFKISFFEIKPIIHLDDSQPLPSKVPADCVASIIVTPDRLPKFIDVLQKQLDKYNAKGKKV